MMIWMGPLRIAPSYGITLNCKTCSGQEARQGVVGLQFALDPRGVGALYSAAGIHQRQTGLPHIAIQRHRQIPTGNIKRLRSRYSGKADSKRGHHRRRIPRVRFCASSPSTRHLRAASKHANSARYASMRDHDLAALIIHMQTENVLRHAWLNASTSWVGNVAPIVSAEAFESAMTSFLRL